MHRCSMILASQDFHRLVHVSLYATYLYYIVIIKGCLKLSLLLSSQEIGLASLGVSEEWITKLAAVSSSMSTANNNNNYTTCHSLEILPHLI